MSQTKFCDKTFHTPGNRCRAFSDMVLNIIDAMVPEQVLDIGCGTGQQIFDLAMRLPQTRFSGVDISGSNVAAANTAQALCFWGDRITLYHADYLEFSGGKYDLIFSGSTLHNIDAAPDLIFTKICGELAEKGYFIYTVPYACLFNYTLWGVRRLFRAIRSSLTDKVIFWGARMLHGSSYSQDLLRERLHYMYLLPKWYDHKALRRRLSHAYGLESVAAYDLPHDSLAQPKHKLLAFRKMAS
ncbi:MAG: class I SAM-dependent methyltransferase [Desulfobaccales bacterium]